MLGIRPIFLTTDELFAAPRAAVETIARRLDVPIDDAGLDAAIAVSAPYPHKRDRVQASADIVKMFKDYVFGNGETGSVAPDARPDDNIATGD
jgi:hypothetical protein